MTLVDGLWIQRRRERVVIAAQARDEERFHPGMSGSDAFERDEHEEGSGPRARATR
jgi:hypothetical protein